MTAVTAVQKCKQLVDELNAEIGDFWVYNIYDTCAADQALPPSELSAPPQRDFHFWHELTPANTFRLRWDVLAGMGDYACGADRVMGEYLAHEAVAKAVHVKEHTSGMEYKRTVDDLRPLYRFALPVFGCILASGGVVQAIGTYCSQG